MAEGDLGRAVGRLEGKVDRLLEGQAQAREEQTVLAGRISALELGRARLLGWCSAVALLVPVLGEHLHGLLAMIGRPR